MILLDVHNKILLDSLTFKLSQVPQDSLSSEQPESTHLLLADFDGVTYKLSTPEQKNVLVLSMSMKCYPELKGYGAEQVLEREYGAMLLKTPEQGYDVSLRIDLDHLEGDKRTHHAHFLLDRGSGETIVSIEKKCHGCAI